MSLFDRISSFPLSAQCVCVELDSNFLKARSESVFTQHYILNTQGNNNRSMFNQCDELVMLHCSEIHFHA